MKPTMAKTLLLLLITGVLVAALCELSCQPTALIERLGGGPGVVVLGPDDPPDMLTLRAVAKHRLGKDVIDRRRSLANVRTEIGSTGRRPCAAALRRTTVRVSASS